MPLARSALATRLDIVRQAGLLHPLPVPSRPWSHIALDFITGLPASAGNSVIMTVVDRFSRQAHFVALPKLPSSEETADLLVDHVVRLHGIPVDIVSDRGPQFVSRTWKAFCRGLGVTASLTSGYHPQSNGLAERTNQSVEAALRCVSADHPKSWSQHLSWVEYALNSMSCSASGLSPFECVFGFQPPLFPEQEIDVGVQSVQANMRRCRRIWKCARRALFSARERARRSADRRRVPAPTYRPGDRVWLRSRDIKLPVKNKKFAPRFVGPYSVETVVNPAAVRLTLPASLKIHPVFHVSQVKPVSNSVLSAPLPVPPDPTVLQGGDLVWPVRKIMAVRPWGRGFQYLVDWVGHGPEERSWVPRAYIVDPDLLASFYVRHPEAPGAVR